VACQGVYINRIIHAHTPSPIDKFFQRSSLRNYAWSAAGKRFSNRYTICFEGGEVRKNIGGFKVREKFSSFDIF
jgi:hypothetical protein